MRIAGMRRADRAICYSPPMNVTNRGFRFLALALIAALFINFAMPARAEAIEPLTIMLIAGVALVVVVVIVVVVIANMADKEKRRADLGELRYLACIESDMEPRNCWPIRGPLGSEVP